MEKALRQRLIGAIVLVVSGVIFIPLLLDGAGHNARFSRDIEIPPEPVIKIKSWDELKEIPANLPPAKNLSKAVDTNKATVKATPSTKKTAKPELKAWALQLGSFGQQTNAQVLQDRLRVKGYRAFIVSSKASGSMRYKVRVGPDLDRSRLDKIAKELKKNENIDTIVIVHP